MAEGRFITETDLGLPAASAERTKTLAEIRMKAEIEAIEDALRRHGHNLSGAAADLGVSRATLYRLMNANRMQTDVNSMRQIRMRRQQHDGEADTGDDAEDEAGTPLSAAAASAGITH
jgi:predicted DNA-binding protein (UPF0251 family)